MPNQLPVTIDFGTLPQTGVGYTPQQFADRLGENGRIFTEQQFALFVTGATAPTSDVGPWAANGNTWYYYNYGLGMYVPFLIPQESLGYFVGATPTPDPTVFKFWVKLDGSGSPIGLFTFFGGNWVDVYAFAGFMTVADFNTAIAAYSTTAQMNSAISAALSSYTNTAGMNAAIAASASSTLAAAQGYTNTQISNLTAYPAQGVTSGTQIIPMGSTTKINYSVATINPAPAPFDTAQARYVAPASGYYFVGVNTQFDAGTNAPGTTQVTIGIYKNGALLGNGMGDIDSTPNPVGGRWSPSFSGLVPMNTNDYIEVFAGPNDGVNTGNINLTVSSFSVARVS